MCNYAHLNCHYMLLRYQADTSTDTGATTTTTTTTTTDTATTSGIATTTTTGTATTTDVVADPRGIPGWNKVGQLAEALVELTGIAMSAAQVDRIKLLYDALDDYDKRAIEVHLRSQQPNLRGSFGRKKRTGHTTVEQMKRYVSSSFICLMCVYICQVFSLWDICAIEPRLQQNC